MKDCVNPAGWGCYSDATNSFARMYDNYPNIAVSDRFQASADDKLVDRASIANTRADRGAIQLVRANGFDDKDAVTGKCCLAQR